MVSCAAYLGLAVLGWGGFAAFFSRPAFFALMVVTFVLAGVSVFAGGSLSSGVREDRGNRWIIAAISLIGLLDAYLPAYTDRTEFWTGALLMVLIMLPPLARIRAEERLLRTQFGDEYDAYCSRTSRLVPGVY